MQLQPVQLAENLIIYHNTRHATSVTRVIDPAFEVVDGFTLGSFALLDDQSVHADNWELHPSGDEVLCVIEGSLEVSVESSGAVTETVIKAGEAVIIPRQTWHRLKVVAPGRLMILTPRAGSELRPSFPSLSAR